MSKLADHQENPLEVLCYKFADVISPTCKQLELTPNHLTTISNIGALMALYSLYHKKWKSVFVVGIAIKYLFDCADGYYARRYGLTSKFGDWYDHISDIVLVIAVVYLIVTSYSFQGWAYPYRGYVIAFGLLFYFLNCIHTGCQERIYAIKNKKTSTEVFSFYQKMCPDHEKYIKITRWVGSTVLYPILLILLIVFFLQ